MRTQAPRYAPAPVYQPPVYQQPQVIAPQPAIAQPLPQATLPAAGQIQQPAVAGPTQSAEQAALQALGQLGGAPQANTGLPQFSPAPQQGAATHVGAWRATVSGQTSVSLSLNADGGFQWTATANGKVSSFAGRYTIDNGQLTLVRNDSQQLAGAWLADNSGGFRFKLAGAQDQGLLFVRG